MNQNLLEAIRLRAVGESESSRQLLLDLVAAQPDDPLILYQCAWTHDAMGLEREAVNFYERAIEAGLGDEDLAGALLGLGSTLRGLGEFGRAVAILEKGAKLFPSHRPIRIFLAMAHYNANRSKEAVSGLLKLLLEASEDPAIAGYRKAILQYAEDLDRIGER